MAYKPRPHNCHTGDSTLTFTFKLAAAEALKKWDGGGALRERSGEGGCHPGTFFENIGANKSVQFGGTENLPSLP